MGCFLPLQNVESKADNQWASGEVRTGKWKVPTYKDYVDLFQHLLNCDQMTVKILNVYIFITLPYLGTCHILLWQSEDKF